MRGSSRIAMNSPVERGLRRSSENGKQQSALRWNGCSTPRHTSNQTTRRWRQTPMQMIVLIALMLLRLSLRTRPSTSTAWYSHTPPSYRSSIVNLARPITLTNTLRQSESRTVTATHLPSAQRSAPRGDTMHRLQLARGKVSSCRRRR